MLRQDLNVEIRPCNVILKYFQFCGPKQSIQEQTFCISITSTVACALRYTCHDHAILLLNYLEHCFLLTCRIVHISHPWVFFLFPPCAILHCLNFYSLCIDISWVHAAWNCVAIFTKELASPHSLAMNNLLWIGSFIPIITLSLSCCTQCHGMFYSHILKHKPLEDLQIILKVQFSIFSGECQRILSKISQHWLR